MILQMFFLKGIETDKTYKNLGSICSILYIGIGIVICLKAYTDNYDYNLKKSVRIRNNFKKISKEFLICIPIYIVEIIIGKLIPVTSQNQLKLVEGFKELPITYFILCIILAPICEEALYRYIPYLFIKNKKLYVIISGFIFAGVHVIGSSNLLLCMSHYLPFSLWLGYRYAKTEDIDVTLSVHVLFNVLASISILINL